MLPTVPHCDTVNCTTIRYSLMPLLRPIATGSPFYIVMLGLLSALPPFGIDAGLPGLAGLQSELGAGAAQAAQTLTLFLVGFAAGPVLFGPLSDRYGRKPILLFGVALFALAALGCALAGSLPTLLALRVLQGIGAGAAASLPAAIVRDVFQGHQGMSRQSYVALVNAVAPLVAPLLGAAVLLFGDWRAINALLAAIGIALFLVSLFGYAETAPPRTDAQGHRRHVLGDAAHAYRAVLRDKRYLLASLLLAVNFGTMFAYIAGSAPVFVGMLGASSIAYGFLFALTAAGTIAGAALNGRHAHRIGAERLLWIGVWGSLACSAVLLLIALLDIRSISLTTLCVIASNFCAGIVMPNATHQSLRDVGNVAGSAAALQRSLQMIVGAGAGALFGLAGSHPLKAMAAVMLGFSVLALVIQAARKSPSAAAEPPPEHHSR